MILQTLNPSFGPRTFFSNRRPIKGGLMVALGLSVAFLASQAAAATYSVSTLSDSGTGSLRAAILSANANKGSTIAFGIAGTINLASSLPVISSPTVIDGTTAPGYRPTLPA